MSGIVIKWIAVFNAILFIIMGLSSSNFVLALVGLISSVFVYGFGEIITILGEIRDKTVSNYNIQQTVQVQSEEIHKNNISLELEQTVKNLHEQGLDITAIAIKTGMTFAQIKEIIAIE